MQKRLLPYIAAVVTFAVLSIIYLLPYYQGQTLNQGDNTQWEGMSKEIVDWNKAHPGDPALWTDAMFGGMPAILISQSFPGNFVNKVFNALDLVFPGVCKIMFLMFVGFYILLLCLDVNPWLSLAGAVAYGLSSFTMISIQAGHNTKVQAMSLMAPVIGSVILTYRKNILLGGALTALFLAMAIDSNHLQITYYLIMMVGLTGLYFLVTSILEKKLLHFSKASVVLIFAALLAFLPNVGNLWSTNEYGKETIRGGTSELTEKKKTTDGGLDFEYASRWSYGLMDGEILSLIIPDIKGGGGANTLSDDDKLVQKFASNGYPIDQVKRFIAGNLYWGNQPFTSGPVYFGAAIVFLFIFSLLIVRSNIRWLLLGLTLLAFLLAFGHNTPFFKWMFNLLPFFNKFRTPAMALVIAQLTTPLMALLGLNEIVSGNLSSDELLKKLKISGGIAAGIVILFGVLGGVFFSFGGSHDMDLGKSNPELVGLLKDERASLLRADAFRSLFFIIAAFGLLWFFIKKKLTTPMLIGGLALIFLVDGWTVAKRYLNAGDFVEDSKYQSSNHSPTQADIDIMRDQDPDYRVLNVTGDVFNEASTSYFHKSVGGYHAAKLIRYQDLIENQISKNNMHVLDMLNTRYIIVEDRNTKQPVAQRNPGALGNAWFVKQIKWVKNADEEMAALTDFDPKNTVVIDERYKKLVPDNAIGSDSGAMIRLQKYTPDTLTYTTMSPTNQLAVFSEIYYDEKKGWNAYLDGKKVDHFRADYVLRAMTIPAGVHVIEFRFEPRSVVLGNKIDYAGSFLLFVFVFGTLGFTGYKKYKEIEALPKEEAKAPAPAVSKPGKKK